MNAQKEILKNNFWGSRKLPHAHEKVCDENERKQTKKQERKQTKKQEKNNVRVKMFLVEGSPL